MYQLNTEHITVIILPSRYSLPNNYVQKIEILLPNYNNYGKAVTI